MSVTEITKNRIKCDIKRLELELPNITEEDLTIIATATHNITQILKRINQLKTGKQTRMFEEEEK